MLHAPLTFARGRAATPRSHTPTDATGDAPRASVHALLNQAVSDLDVVCTGVEDGRLFFEVTRPNTSPSDLAAIAHKIVERLLVTPDPIRSVLSSSIAEITVSLKKPG